MTSQADAYVAATRLSSMRVLFVDWICPEPDRDSGSIRTVSMLQMLLAMRAHVTFAPLDARRHPRYAAMLRYMGVEVVAPLRRLVFHQREGGQGCRYDLILVARRECYDEVFRTLQSVCTAVPKIFDTVDLHFMREAKAKRFKMAHAGDMQLLQAVFGEKNLAAKPTEDADRERELKYIGASKVTVVVSEVEMREIRRYRPDAQNLVRVSNIHEDLDDEITPAAFARRSGCVFVGNWNHLPNRDAAVSEGSLSPRCFSALALPPSLSPRLLCLWIRVHTSAHCMFRAHVS